MISNEFQTAIQTPSGIGMPTSGPISGTASMSQRPTSRGTTDCTTAAYAVRDRHVAGAVESLAKGAFPGPHAWSPPTC